MTYLCRVKLILVMKTIVWYCCAFFIGLQTTNAQQKLQNIFHLFSQPQPINWTVSLPNAQALTIEWQEREVNSNSQGFRSFVGYYQNQLVGVISFNQQTLSGELFYKGKSYVLSSNNKGFLEITESKDGVNCGNRVTASHSATARNQYYEGNEDKNDPPIEKPEIYNSLYPDALIHTDGVFRHYRLALPVDYSIYNSKYFNRDVNKVKAFWYATIAFANELYRNDVGVDFTLVDDEALIFTTAKDQLFRRGEAANEVVYNGTITLNKKYDPNKYDLAVILTDYREKYNGLAAVYSAYEQHNKANAAARPIKPSTIAHEIGHMFGADHTFSNGGQYTSKTEIGSGQSIMSYGHEHPRDFFSLISLETIRRFLGNSMAYYADEARTQEAGKRVEGTGSNLVYGVKSNNQPPILDRSHLKKEYIIPKNTYFQFYLTGTDAENDTITYMAHQADRRFHSTKSNARFMTYKGKTNGNIRFETTWFEKERNTFAPIAATSPLNYTPGTFTFWLAAADHNRADRNHVVKYDIEEVKVKIAEGKPFEIQKFDNGTWEQNRTYKGGQLLTLHWQVDKSIFGEDSKVRILLSDDSGKTYKYILKEITDNNGVCDVILPNINIGTTNGHFGKRRGQGIIKIEVIDGLAFALSCASPYKDGGFMIEKDKNAPSPLTLVAGSVPPKYTTIACANEMPNPAKIETQGGCGRVTSDFTEEKTNEKCKHSYTLKRTYTFKDECYATVKYEQYITVKDDKAPAFVGLLPNDVSIEEGAALPEAKTLTAKDNCAGNLQIKPSVSKAAHKVVYSWKATDDCGNSTEHTQTISINIKPQITTPTVTTPTVTTPTVTTPTVTTPTVSTPTVSTPTVSTPTVTTPTVSTPTVSTPTVSTPTVSTPTVTTPTVSTPTVSTPTVSTPTVSTPTVSTPTVSTPTVTTPTVSTPTVSTPTVSTPTVSTPTEDIIIYNGVSTTDPRNYFRIENTDADKPISVIIFDEMGLKVYETDHYQEKGEVFRGVANVHNVMGRRKVVVGTYFYIITYYKNGRLENKKGYLYVN